MIFKELRETQNVRGSRAAFSEWSQRLQIGLGTEARTDQTESKTNNAAESQSTALARAFHDCVDGVETSVCLPRRMVDIRLNNEFRHFRHLTMKQPRGMLMPEKRKRNREMP